MWALQDIVQLDHELYKLFGRETWNFVDPNNVLEKVIDVDQIKKLVKIAPYIKDKGQEVGEIKNVEHAKAVDL